MRRSISIQSWCGHMRPSPPKRGFDSFGNPPAGDAQSHRSSLDAFVVPPNQKEIHMRLRLFRVLYLISTVTAFVVAAGAGRKFCGG